MLLIEKKGFLQKYWDKIHFFIKNIALSIFLDFYLHAKKYHFSKK